MLAFLNFAKFFMDNFHLHNFLLILDLFCWKTKHGYTPKIVKKTNKLKDTHFFLSANNERHRSMAYMVCCFFKYFCGDQL